MNEFNIMKYLNDINLKEVLTFIKTQNNVENSIDQYFFQAKDENKDFVSGYVTIFNNKITINYEATNNLMHLFTSTIKLYSGNCYLVSTKHVSFSNEDMEIIENKKGYNIPLKNIFSFKENQDIKSLKKIKLF